MTVTILPNEPARTIAARVLAPIPSRGQQAALVFGEEAAGPAGVAAETAQRRTVAGPPAESEPRPRAQRGASRAVRGAQVANRWTPRLGRGEEAPESPRQPSASGQLRVVRRPAQGRGRG